MKNYSESYAEKKGLRPIQWSKRLRRAIRFYPTREEFYEMEKSLNWIQGPCGNLHRDIPRKKIGEPKDKILSGLEIDFRVEVIVREDYKTALKILHKIERRAKRIRP